MKLIGSGSADRLLGEDEVAHIVDASVGPLDVDGKHVVVLVPDGTRSAPIPLMLRLLDGALGDRPARTDVLIALGTHQPMDDAALDALVGATGVGRANLLPRMTVHNHEWSDPETFVDVGTVPAAEVAEISGGLLATDVPVRVNRLVVDADLVIVCGPVFPHEVVGFSGGNKYFFPGVSGPEVIDTSHWLGALITNYVIIGTLGTTPVRALINRAANLITTPKLCLAMVVQAGSVQLNGLWAGSPEDAWAAAAELSAQTHVRYVDHPYRTVLSVMPTRYDDMWTAAKGMYKVEPIVADGGEVIVYAPHITEFSATHGADLARIGYHVRDYFLAERDRVVDIPLSTVAHSTHLRGQGTYVDGVERPRITVTLATGIPEDVVRAHNLSYRDPTTIDVTDWLERTEDDILVVLEAGEDLYRLRHADEHLDR